MVMIRWACLALFLAGCGGPTTGPGSSDEAVKQKEAQIDRFKERNAKAVKKPTR